MDSNIQSIAKLVEFIEAHLDSLAARVGYSKYHLHRMFISIAGLPIHGYVQRRTLTEAARLLIFSEQSLMDIALFAGYETRQSFTRAFGELFGCSPGAFREKRDFYPLQLKFTVDGKQNQRGDRMMDCKIVESDKILLAGYKANTADGFAVIGACWEQLYQNMHRIPNRLDNKTLIVLDDYTKDFVQDAQPASTTGPGTIFRGWERRWTRTEKEMWNSGFQFCSGIVGK